MAIDFSQNPYYDDYDEDKEFYRILFRPGYAVQARELTQIQTLLQNQVRRFGNHIFKNGSVVYGGQLTLERDQVYYLKLQTTYNGQSINVDDYVGKFITDDAGTGIRGYVLTAEYDPQDGNPPTLMVKYVSAQQFGVSTDFSTVEDEPIGGTTLDSAPSGLGSVCSISDGIFFLNGFFAKVSAQSIVLSRYSTTPSYRVGIQLSDSVVDEGQDASLLDPAVDASNYQAPGATRYKIHVELAKRTLASTDDSAFIDLLRVENGKIIDKVVYPQYSDLENTLARRTYDESGNYVVRPFQISLQDHPTDEDLYNVVLEPGKAYVLGYEFETIAPKALPTDRSRDTANVSSYPLTINYQNYVELTNLVGFPPIANLRSMTVHCVDYPSINTLSVSTAQATEIGTVRVRALDYDSGASSTNVMSAIWRGYLFDANIKFRSANATGGSSNTIILDSAAASQNDAYKGVTLRIVTHAGQSVGEVYTIRTYNGNNKTANIEGSFRFGTPTTATIFSLDYEFSDAESFVYVGDGLSNVFSTNASISSQSHYSASADPYQSAFISETNFNNMIFPLPNFAIGAAGITTGSPIQNTSYYARYAVIPSSFASNTASITTSPGMVAAVSGTLSGTDAMENIMIVLNSGAGNFGGYSPGDIINFLDTANCSVSVSTASGEQGTSTYTITVKPKIGSSFSPGFTAYLKVQIPYADITNPSYLKLKNLKIANTTIIDPAATTTVDTGITWCQQGGSGSANGAQLVFSSSAIKTLQTPNQPQSIYTSDVVRLRKVYDFGTKIPTTANLATAIDLTAGYVLDNGQRDNSYDHGSITLQPYGYPPTGNVVVFLDYYEHTAGGYLTVDSYVSGANIAYTDIPTYTSKQSAQVYYLRDCIDFRPIRMNANKAFKQQHLPVSGQNFQTDFSYYLSRIDKVILTKDRKFEIVRGISSLVPKAPADQDNAMTLYTLSLPPYTGDVNEIKIKYVDNRRYTMRDIGALEHRISNLEYYSSLSLLEQAAKDQQILDDYTGMNRYKNGIIVDPFKGHSIGDVTRPDYFCSIDFQNQYLRPGFFTSDFKLAFDATNSTNYRLNGAILTLDYDEVALITQPYASTTININPFNVVSFMGQIYLDPSSDIWVDTNQLPDVILNLDGGNDSWDSLYKLLNKTETYITTNTTISTNTSYYKEVNTNTSNVTIIVCHTTPHTGKCRVFPGQGWGVHGVPSQKYGIWPRDYPAGNPNKLPSPTRQIAPREFGEPNECFGKEWDSWKSHWCGVECENDHDEDEYQTSETKLSTTTSTKEIQTTVTDITQKRTITNVQTTFNTKTITNALGTRVVDVSIVPYIRPRSVLFTARAFKPSTSLYAFFDKVSVQPYITLPSIIRVASNTVSYIDKYQENEIVRVYDPGAQLNVAYGIVSLSRNDATGTNVSVVGLSAGDDYEIANLRVLSTNTTFLIGMTSGESSNSRIIQYIHQSGLVNVANTNTMTLSEDARYANNTTNAILTGKQVVITAGQGEGQTVTITSYDVSNNSITVSPNFGVIPLSNSVYSIGALTSDQRGEATGLFMIPSTDTTRFRVGERIFRLTDTSTGDLSTSTTSGDARYFAQGTLQTVENTIVSTRVPVVTRTVTTSEEDITSTVVTRSIINNNEPNTCYLDPLAQTFLIDQVRYPGGVQITSLRLMFKSKDPSIPVRVQIRPVVNGYPHSSKVVPYGDVLLNAEKVTEVSEAVIGQRFNNPSALAPLDDPSLYTNVVFDAPITLQAGQEYAIVLISNSMNYEVYMSQVGQLLLGTGRLISSQPYLGVLFKSQNSSTWTAVQEDDLMFKLMCAQYKSNDATVQFLIDDLTSPAYAVPVDTFFVTSQNLILPDTKITTEYMTTLRSTSAADAWKYFDIAQNVYFTDTLGRRVILPYPTLDSFKLREHLHTDNLFISPMCDIERMGLITIENAVNNLDLNNLSFVIANTTNTFVGPVATVDISGGDYDSPAVLQGRVTSNVLSKIEVIQPGAGYKSTPTITVVDSNGSANVYVVGENQATGGIGLARYITRRVKLADGFDAGDLRVYLTAYKPEGTNIYVYYKLLSAEDTASFDSRDYQLMTQIDNHTALSLNRRDWKELSFAPGTNNTPANHVSYGSFTTFKYFSIKIVMTTTNPTLVPLIKNFRAIAVPAMTLG